MTDAKDLWRAKTDDELIEAGEELYEYTEDGERIIRAELRRRGLPQPPPPIATCSRCGRSIAPNDRDECSQCGEPFPPDVLRALGAASAQSGDLARTAKTSSGEPLTVKWEDLRSDGADFSLQRAKVPGGWLVCGTEGSLTFVPDVEHKWNENFSE